MRKNLTSEINEKKPPKPLSGNSEGKPKRLIDKKPPNLVGTAEEN